MDSLSDEIIELLNQKKEAAFEVVFNLYYPRLVYFAKEYVPYEDAKGLVQDAFVTFWEKSPVVLSHSQLQSYLYTLVKNNCLMRLRHEKYEKAYKSEMEIKMQNKVYLSALEQLDTSLTTFQEMEAIIQKTLSELTPKCRKVFLMSRMEGIRNHEIAEELRISVKAVEAHITKALKAFKVSLKDFLPLLTYLLTTNS